MALKAITLIHTLAWFSIESCVLYVLWAGFKRRSDRRVAIAAGVVATETTVFADSWPPGMIALWRLWSTGVWRGCSSALVSLLG